MSSFASRSHSHSFVRLPTRWRWTKLKCHLRRLELNWIAFRATHSIRSTWITQSDPKGTREARQLSWIRLSTHESIRTEFGLICDSLDAFRVTASGQKALVTSLFLAFFRYYSLNPARFRPIVSGVQVHHYRWQSTGRQVGTDSADRVTRSLGSVVFGSWIEKGKKKKRIFSHLQINF